MKLFDKEIILKTHYCGYNGNVPEKIEEPYINLYIQLKGCDAKCSFCEFMGSAQTFNIIKFEDNLLKLKDQIKINKVSITGGEPTLNYKLLCDILFIVKKHLPNVFLVMNTNGYNLKKLDSDNLISKFDSISVSRHHYDENINNIIFKTNTLSNTDLYDITSRYKDIFHFSCTTMKGYIGSVDEVYKYLDFCNEMGVYDVGFVGLMKMNDFCYENFVDIKMTDLLSERFHKIKEYRYFNSCRCDNYLYIPINLKEQPVKVYSRCVLNNDKPINIIVFDGVNLRIGFNGEIIN